MKTAIDQKDAFSTNDNATPAKSHIVTHKLNSGKRKHVMPLPEVQLKLILDCLEDAKAEAITHIDIKGKSALADFMVIASGRSNRHVIAAGDQLLRKLQEENIRNVKVEGLSDGDWVLIDTGDVIVHIFRLEIREFYNIEKLWQHPASDTK